MPVLTGGSFKEIAPDDIKTRTTSLNQLIDVIQEDVSGSANMLPERSCVIQKIRFLDLKKYFWTRY